jgi:putative flippase GtrA
MQKRYWSDGIILSISSKFIRFLLVGILNTAFGYGAYALFVFFNFHYSVAMLCATFLGVLFNFKTIGSIVFKNHNTKLIFRFFLVYCIVYVFNVLVLTLFRFLGYKNMYIVGFLVVIPSAMLSFFLNKKFVFERHT